MIERGMHVFPLKTNTKDPKFKGWQTAALAMSADSVMTHMGYENWGIHPGPSGHFVIDVDVKNGKVGDKTWALICEQHGDMPQTLTVRTPTKGVHYYFKGVVEGNSALGQDVDVRTTGGYVVAPGSEIDGQMYKVIDDRPIAEAPQWLLQMLAARSTRPAEERIVISEVDKDIEVDRAIKYLRDAKAAVEGSNGNTTTYEVAVSVRDFGISEEKNLELMLAHYNDRCSPPWSEGELSAIVENAYKYAQNSLGARSVEAATAAATEDFDDVPEAPPEDMSDLDKRLAARRFDVEKPPVRTEPVLWVGETGVAKPGDLVVVQAKVKAGKSSVLGAMMASIIGKHDQGHDYLGWRGQNPAGLPVIHFDTEQSPEDHYDLIKRTLDRAGIEKAPKWFYSYCITDFGMKEQRKALGHQVQRLFAEYGGVCAIFLDGIGDLCKDLNDGVEANDLVQHIYNMAIKYSCPFVNVLHENHSSETGKTRGHLGSQLERKAASNLRLEKNDKGIITLWADKLRRGHIPKGEGPTFVWDKGRSMHISTVSHREAVDLEKAEAILEQRIEIEEFLEVQVKDRITATDLNNIALAKGLWFANKNTSRFVAYLRESLATSETFHMVGGNGGPGGGGYAIERDAVGSLL